METEFITIKSKTATWILIFLGAISLLAIVFGALLATAKNDFNMNAILGCLPGTQATLQVDQIGDRRDQLTAKCVRVEED